MKCLEIPDLPAKVNFVWMNVEEQRKMCDEDLTNLVVKFHPDLIFEEVDTPEDFADTSTPCQTAQPAYVPPEVVAYITHEIDEMKAQLADYKSAYAANTENELATGYLESIEAVLAEDIARKEV